MAGLNQEIKNDLYRYKGKRENVNFFLLFLQRSGARFIVLSRMCNHFSVRNLGGIFFRLWFKGISTRFNVEVPHCTTIGPGLFMGHFKNITINPNATIGSNCNISQGVTIGSESRGKKKGAPTIGDRVAIGPNSVISGNIQVGHDVLVGPLTFVNFDVPDNSVVLGNPAKIISSNGSKGYVNHIRRVHLSTEIFNTPGVLKE